MLVLCMFLHGPISSPPSSTKDFATVERVSVKMPACGFFSFFSVLVELIISEVDAFSDNDHNFIR